VRAEARRPRRFLIDVGAVLMHPQAKTVFDIFGSELSDGVFEGVFERPRHVIGARSIREFLLDANISEITTSPS
jgi:hypothetical protein